MKYIITDSIKNVNSIIRRKNRNGEPVFGTEAITALGLAWSIIMRDQSHIGTSNLRMINNNTAAAIVLELMMKDPKPLSFVPEESYCLQTAHEVLDNMNLLRANSHEKISNQVVDELTAFMADYENVLEQRHLLDEISAVLKASDLLKKNGGLDSSGVFELCYFKEPSEAEKTLVDLITNGKADEMERPAATTDVTYSFVRCYGIANEADYVAKTILEKKIPYGDVQILCDPAVYVPYIYQAFTKRNIPVQFVSGISAAGLNTIQLYKGLMNWYLGNCNYKDLSAVMQNPLFAFEYEGKQHVGGSAYLKGINYKIGWGKERYQHVERSDYDQKTDPAGTSESARDKAFRETELPALGSLANKLDMANTAADAFDALSAYIKDHTFTRNMENRYLSNRLSALGRNIQAVKIPFQNKGDMLDYICHELETLGYVQEETGDAVDVSSIMAPTYLERKNIFVIGLSAKEFKPNIAESPVLTDDMRKELFGENPKGNVTCAMNAVDEAEQIVRNTLDTAVQEANIMLVYAGADVMRDGSSVASSALFEKLLEEHGGKVLDEARYYEITDDDVLIKNEDAWPLCTVETKEKPAEIQKTFSSSSLETFLDCPLKYHYEKELYIQKEEHAEYDPTAWLNAAGMGTLFHAIMEEYGNAVLKGKENVSPNFDENSAEFKQAVEKAKKRLEKENAVPNEAAQNLQLQETVDIAIAYLRWLHQDLTNNGWTVKECELQVEPQAFSYEFEKDGTKFVLRFNGYIDRIDEKITEDGKRIYRIVDYKTGQSENDKQPYIYAAYVAQKYNSVVHSFSFDRVKQLKADEPDWKKELDENQLKSGEILSDNPEKEGDISERQKFYAAFLDHQFVSSYERKKSGPCRFCKYSEICLNRI